MLTSFQRLSVIRQGEKGGGLRVAPLLACRMEIPPALPHGGRHILFGVNRDRPQIDIALPSVY